MTVPECSNCGAFVSRAYMRVLVPEDLSDPRVCPFCEDRIRDGAGVRAARSSRR